MEAVLLNNSVIADSPFCFSPDEEEMEDLVVDFERALSLDGPTFRKLSLVPAVREILGPDPPILQAAPVDHHYQNVDHYLSTQFHLLREDFCGPLREGIRAYLNPQKHIPNQNMYVYPKASIFSFNAKHSYHVIKFWCPRMWQIDWKEAKRFMSGQLLCITKDNFDTVVLATVAMTRMNFLKKGFVGVIFESAFQVKEYLNCEFMVIEAPAYFDMYRNVLASMSKFTEETLPLSNFITGKNVQTAFPYYLSQNKEAVYIIKGYMPESMHPTRYAVSVVNNCNWPSAKQLGLDESQIIALKSALMNDVTVIQGPPGTGKTFVGLRIVEALVQNQTVWRGEKRRGPVMVVTYTNHALDQFLEGVCQFTEKIVRIGGGCVSSKLQKFKLSAKVLKCHKLCAEAAREELVDILKEIIVLEQTIDLMANGSVVDVDILRVNGVITEKEKEMVENFGGMRRFLCVDDLEVLFNIDAIGGRSPPEPFDELGTVSQLLESMNGGQQEEFRQEKGNREEEDWLLETPPEVELSAFSKESIEHFAFRIEEVDAQIAVVVKALDSGSGPTEFLEGELEILEEKKKKVAELALQVVSDSDLERPELTTMDSRWALYSLWHRSLTEKLTEERSCLEIDYKDAAQKIRDLQVVYSEEVCRDALVVGMTTSGAAKYNALLKHLESKIVIVEEAAKVLEAHVVSSLTEKCEQLVMIGDHKQLRPFIQNHRLKKSNLDVSLFERLVKLGMDPCVLQMQHRMRPEIAKLITPAVYPVLKDHPKVLQYPKVKGLAKNLFFFDRQSEERREKATASFFNVDEAKIALELARYLLNQGYPRSSITIITAYNGQIRCLEKLVRENVRYASLTSFDPLNPSVAIRTIDEYQGEENDVIILSLVRSNVKNAVGFLDDEHRVTVALSRARHGLYVLGDWELLLASGGKLWKQVLGVFREQDAFGPAIKLRCDKHQHETEVGTYEDFVNLPGQGCPELCGAKLQCGHLCKQYCHHTNLEHRGYVCKESATKQRCDNVAHISTGPCSDVKCTLRIYVSFRCGHTALIVCHQLVLATCQVLVPVMCKGCGCETMIPCADYRRNPDVRSCTNNIQKKLVCGHLVKVICGNQAKDIKCTAVCNKQLPCGHGKCAAPCHKGKCRDYFRCRQTCSKVVCKSHNLVCKRLCWKPCIECSAICNREICTKHTLVCKRLCKNVCIKCNEVCNQLICEAHNTSCTRSCLEKCDKCPQRCYKMVCKRHNVVCQRLCSNSCIKCTFLCEKIVCKKHNSLCQQICSSKCGKCPELCGKIVCTRHNLVCQRLCGNGCITCTKMCNKIVCNAHNTKCTQTCGSKCDKCPAKCNKLVCATHNLVCQRSCGKECISCTKVCGKLVCVKHNLICQRLCKNSCIKCKDCTKENPTYANGKQKAKCKDFTKENVRTCANCKQKAVSTDDSTLLNYCGRKYTTKKRGCGHPVERVCSETVRNLRCKYPVNQEVKMKCGHTVGVKVCWELQKVKAGSACNQCLSSQTAVPDGISA